MVRWISLVIVIIFFQPGFAEAIKRRPSKECLLCHVLWFDAFKTDKQILIKSKDSSIVIEGAVGLASSREMCDTCHDGYIVDSRVKVVKGNPHHGLNKVPDWLKLPQGFRLDSNNEMYCGTCHTLHDIRGGERVGSTPFLRMDNERSQMCMACHVDKTKRQRYANHPVLKEVKNVPQIEAAKKGIKFGPKREIICQSCHNTHSRRAMIVPLKNSTLCFICHKNKKSLIDSKHDLRITLPEATNITQQKPSETGPCSACHLPHKATGQRLWARRLKAGNPASQMCLSCHGDSSGIRTRRVGKFSHPVDVASALIKKIPKTLPLYSSEGTQDVKGRVQCFTCHNVHRWNPVSPADKGGKFLEGNSSNSFLRVANNTSSSLCLTCHSDKKQVLSSDHNLTITAPHEENYEGFIASTSGPCGACHIPHNAGGVRLWARRLNRGNPASQMCLSCHDQKIANIKKTVGKYSHPINIVPSLTTAISHDLPLFSEDATQNSNGSIQCLSCHDAHTWAPDSLSSNKGKNIEGDPTNSFLRISNAASSALCLKCHLDKEQLVASDHNLIITAPQERNLDGLTAGASGPCGACHVPHNAASRYLWAKQMSGKKDFITQLCTGCHNQNGAAKAKLIGRNYHPVDVAFDKLNIKQDNKMISPLLPFYDGAGNKKSGGKNGKMVCITCHEPHTWSPRQTEPILNYTFKNMEGDTTNSFLRKPNFPSSDLCKACHADKALVDGTKHDLNITGPKAKNLLGQTVKESGQCGVCHLVHNSPNKLKLWARPYGPISKTESMMDALCTGCHSKGNIAENKVPLIATHPKEKLISNVIQFYRDKKNYTPIFDNNGDEVNLGNLSCPSCHNAHQWSLKTLKTGGVKKNPGNQIAGKFLRIKSYNIVCKNCHGADAIFRYQYFHVPEKRLELKKIKKEKRTRVKWK